jgi:hypothetical protein
MQSNFSCAVPNRKGGIPSNWDQSHRGSRPFGKDRVVQFDEEASQTRDYCVAKNATVRAARPDSLGKLGTGSSLRKERLLRMTIKLHRYPKS